MWGFSCFDFLYLNGLTVLAMCVADLLICKSIDLFAHCHGLIVQTNVIRNFKESYQKTTLSCLLRVADIPGRRALCSACTDRLEVPYFKLSTIGCRAFPVAASQIWNSLPDTVVSAPTLRSFQHQLKTFYFNDPSFISTVIVVSQ